VGACSRFCRVLLLALTVDSPCMAPPPGFDVFMRIQLVLFGIQNRALGPCLAAIHRIFIRQGGTAPASVPNTGWCCLILCCAGCHPCLGMNKELGLRDALVLY
jgi:hypothetical protein